MFAPHLLQLDALNQTRSSLWLQPVQMNQNFGVRRVCPKGLHP